MSVGISEVVLLGVVLCGSILMSILGRNGFYLGMVPLFVIAMLVTPADPASCLLVGAPAIMLYGFTVRQLQSRDTSEDN